MKNCALLAVVILGAFPLLLTGCTNTETSEQRISRVVAQLLSAPDEYLSRQDGLETILNSTGENLYSEVLASTEYQIYLEELFAEEDFTAQLYSKLAQFRLVNLMYPVLCADAGISVEVEDIKVQLELEQSRIYSVEGRAVLDLEGSRETLPISGKVQTDENGRISSINVDGSTGEITAQCLVWVNAH